jgi:Predicted methyltransferase
MFLKIIKAIRLNHKARMHVDEVLAALAVEPGMTVADIGAGGGYYTFKFSEVVGPQGKVYAVDIDKAFLRLIAGDARRRGIRNVEPLRSGPNGGALPPDSCDLAFCRNAFHHLPSPLAYMRNLRFALKRDGRIAIIDWLPNRDGGTGHRHGIEAEEIQSIMEKAGYDLVASYDFLQDQSFGIYRYAGGTKVRVND